MRAFLSHSSRDKPLVETVASRLGGANIELDSLTFEHGLPNAQAIQEALKRSSLFVLFLSTDALASSFVEYEQRLSEDLVARGVIDKIVVLCLGSEAFDAVGDNLKRYNIVRKISSAQAIARLIQHHLIIAIRKTGERDRPFVGRQQSLNEAKNQLIDPVRELTQSVFVSGNAGIGRRTFARKLYADVFPYVGTVLPEIHIDSIDGFDEIHRKVVEVHTPIMSRSALASLLGEFSSLPNERKAAQIASMIGQIVSDREAIFIIDRGGLLDDFGKLSEPFQEIHRQLPTFPHPGIIFIAERMLPKTYRESMRSSIFCALPSLSIEESRQLIALILREVLRHIYER
jgi:hypothetical protein